MRQLNGIDVSFLNLESGGNYGHISSLNLFDAAGLNAAATVEVMKALIAERLDQLVPFRRRLVEVPLGLDLPYWIDDPDFDLDFHVRHHAVPAPGTPEQLSEIISRIHGRPLDRSRPLWEMYIIEGVDEGRTIAQFTKVHHAAIDGAAGALMLAALLDVDPSVRPTGDVAQWDPEPIPTEMELLARTATEYLHRPEKMVRLTVQTLRELSSATRSGGVRVLADLAAQPIPGPVGRLLRQRLRAGTEGELDHPPALPPAAAPRTPWNRQISPHRRFAYTSVDLETAKQIRRAVGCTFNDVVMAIASGALRRYLELHDCLPDDPLVAMVPVSVRTGTEDDMFQNRVSAMFTDLATDEADPLARLERVRTSLSRAKDGFQAIPAEHLQDFTRFAPPAVAARAMRMFSRLRIADRLNPPFNLVISNVPGPDFALYAAGARLRHFYPVSTLIDGQGLNMTVQSYCGHLDFGIVADRELVPDVWVFTELLQASLAELHDAVAGISSRGRRRARPVNRNDRRS